MEKHEDLVVQRPSPIGITGMAVYPYFGTNKFSWYVYRKDGVWHKYGKTLTIREFKNV